ncbi:MAG: DALR domain-containing protein, partial [Candidatus Bathyarchaeia archaeon]
YRSPMDFNRENLKLTESNLERIVNMAERFSAMEERTNRTPEEERLLAEVRKAKERFEEAMDDDFNTPLAISAIFDVVKAVNSYVEKNGKIETSAKKEIYETFTKLLDVLGIKLEVTEQKTVQAEDIRNLMALIIEIRQELRKRGDWKTADEIRDKLQKIGFVLEDTVEGTRWKMKS